MAKKALLLLFLFFTLIVKAQLTGKVTDTSGNPLPFVNVYVENSFIGTTTNEQGYYKLDAANKTDFLVVFQYLGFKTKKIAVSADEAGITLNVALEEESYSLDEVVLHSSENPANRIIRNAIENRRKNLEKTSDFTADFYSRGIWRLKDVPEKILGQEVGDFEGALDSTRTGIVYLSETISQIAYQRPNNFKEHIIASKVSGNDNGFSFNSAQEANFSFYENTIEINTPLVSPIANNAFGYYNYILEGAYYEENQLINKIKVTPKRPNDRIFSGYIYIVEESWQIHGIELQTSGNAIQVPFVESILFKQNFSYDDTQNLWIKISQSIDFSFSILKMKGDGRYTAAYSNYNFNPQFEKKSFTNEVLTFEQEANKKDSLFWNKIRPIPLTSEESDDYIRRDSIQTVRKSKTYLDSLDRISNKFKILSPITGYSFTDTYNHKSLSYNGVLKGISFNTIQGLTLETGLQYRQWKDENYSRVVQIGANANYGFAEDRFRPTAYISKRFNRYNRRTISISGGSKLQQFNESNPILPMLNGITSLYFKRNYLKAYELNYARIGYSEEIANGVKISATIGYENRQALLNHSNRYFIPYKDRSYTSNDPLNPINQLSKPFEEHDIVKLHLNTQFTFGQKYLSYPDAKFNLSESKYPVLALGYEKGFSATNTNYDFDQIKLSVQQDFVIGNKGNFAYRLNSGTFFNADKIAFADYQHFNGNQTRIGTSSNYLNVFNLLPYYNLSTNGSYFEGHVEHDFKGFILGKVPLLNKLNYNLIVGAHFLSTENKKPYSELSVGMDNIGIGKLKLMRVDYVHSFYNGGNKGAFIFGLKFLNLLN